MYHDSKLLAKLICHKEPLSIYEQIILAKFIEDNVRNETISQYKFKGLNVVQELLSFTKTWSKTNSSSSQALDDSDDEEAGEGLIERIKQAITGGEQ